MTEESLFYDLVSASDIDAAYALEIAGYPADEAATLEALRYRQSVAPELFLGAFVHPRILRGFICATRSSAKTLTHASMATHEPEGSSVCIHSVCIDSAHRRKGIALGLLKDYGSRLDAAAREKGYASVLLITHEELVQLYARAGYTLVGPSAVAHGARQWFEMSRTVEKADPAGSGSTTNENEATLLQTPPPGIWEALAATSSTKSTRPKGQPFGSFSGVTDLVGEGSRSKYAISCARDGCASLVLLAGAAQLIEAPSVKLEPTPHPQLPPLPSAPTSTHWWHITGGPMSFENVTFTRPTTDVHGDGRSVKLLACGECETGPIGWAEITGKESWVHTSRVAYRVD